MTKGIRHDYDDNTIPQPGEYGRDQTGRWYGCPPEPLDTDGFALLAGLSAHQVTEHEDGTITVSPSILIREWHGFLERGVWRKV